MADIIGLGVGLIIAGLGIYMCVTGDVRLLHGYHYATTPESERPQLARETGAGLIGCGTSFAFLVPSFLPDWLSILGAVLLVASIAEMLIAIIRRNGGLATFPGDTRPGLFASMHPGIRMALAVCLGAALSLIGIVPGAQMIATGGVGPLHSYHYAHVAAADLPRLATCEGACMIALGIALFCCAVAGAGMLRRPMPLWAKALMCLGAALFTGALAGMLGFIIYFNGSLMG